MDDPQPRDGITARGTAAECEDTVSLTTAFGLLARSPRRRLLYMLHRSDDPTVSLDALARQLDECDVDLPGTAGEVRVVLHHVHLPKLVDADVVEYDPDGEEVRYLGDPRLDGLLEWGLRQEGLD